MIADEAADTIAEVEQYRLAILCHARHLRKRLEDRAQRRGKEIEALNKALRTRRREVQSLWRRIKATEARATTAETDAAALRALLRRLYDYAVRVEGIAAMTVVRRPDGVNLPGTEAERERLGEDVRAALDAAAQPGEGTQ